MLTAREIGQVFKYYFNQYFVKPDGDLYKAYQKRFMEEEKIFDVMYCYGNRHDLLQCGCAYLDLDKHYMQHTQIYSYDILNNFLHLGENTTEKEVFYEYPPQPLIIYHPAGTTSNQRLLSLITHIMSYRSLKKEKTLILTEVRILNDIMDKVTKILDLTPISQKVNDEEYEV